MCNGNTKRREKNRRTIEMIMIENFPELMSDAKPQIQQAQRTPSRINAKNNKIPPKNLRCSI